MSPKLDRDNHLFVLRSYFFSLFFFQYCKLTRFHCKGFSVKTVLWNIFKKRHNILKNIFACLFNVHNTISLSRHEQVCLMRLRFEGYFSYHRAYLKHVCEGSYFSEVSYLQPSAWLRTNSYTGHSSYTEHRYIYRFLPIYLEHIFERTLWNIAFNFIIIAILDLIGWKQVLVFTWRSMKFM